MKTIKTIHGKITCLFILLLTSTLLSKADSITNNFDASYDYVANGIVGDTNWDGVYLGFGDIPNGNAGGSGNGSSSIADANVTFPSFLTVETAGSDWSGNGDDGFFLYKVVAGDFDVSVQSAPPFPAVANNFAGLMVRAYNTNNSGAPVSFTSTNASENWLALFRAQEFGINEIREATNAANFENTFTDDSTDTNSTRYYRITRVGDTFSFYWKTNASDSWVLITNASAGGGYDAASGSVTRSDWDGQPVQVGIAEAMFSRNTAQNYFTDFELNGTNVNFPVMPAAPANLVTSSPNPDGSLTLSWNTNGGTGSILIVRKISPGGVLIANPIQGLTYTADSNFRATNTLIAGNTHVVYAGPATNVIVSGLGGSNNLYTAEVLSYDSSGASIVYNTASPATNSFLGTGIPASVAINVFPTNLPVGGAGQVQVIATFTTGDQVDITTDPSVTLTSSDPTTVLVNNGVLNALQTGTANITADYAGFSGTNNVAVAAPRFTDNFSIPHSYLTNGLPGSAWDGLYLRSGDLPGATYAGVPVQTTGFNADVTSNNVLTLTAANSSWAGASDNGPFLFKHVPGDFEAAVHVTSIPRAASGDGSVAYMFVGLLARGANADGSPLNGSENWVDWTEFDQYSVSTHARTTINGADSGDTYEVADGQTTSDYWILMQRVNSTNFYFYKKVNVTDPWEAHPEVTIVQPSLTNGVPVQVGLFQATFGGNSGTVQFDNFMLDAENISGGTPPSATTGLMASYDPTNNTMTLTWTPGTNSDGSVQTSFVVMRQDAPISAQPYFGDLTSVSSIFGQGTDLGGGNYVVYRDTGNTVTVSGLTAGAVYYAAVYGYSGGGATKSFNLSGSVYTPAIQAGVFTGVSASISGAIPLGGIGLPVVTGLLQGGAAVDVSSSATITSGDTNVIAATNGVLTGLAIGSATNTVTFLSGTNVFTTNLVAVVRAPTYTDDFSVSHDYFADGVTNTTWDGVYAYPKFTIPDTTFVSDPAASVFSADANITSNNVLTVTSENVGWENAQDDGFFLFKYVPADFQVAVHITTPLLDTNNNVIASYNYPGLLARPYSVDASGNIGAPFDTNGDSWISWARFDEFGIGTRAERIIDNNTLPAPSTDVGDGQLWLLEVRQNGTNFLFYQRANATDPWQPAPAGQSFSVPSFAGAPMQVGIEEGGFDSGTVDTGQFDSFMLDVSVFHPTITASSSDGNINLSWPATGSFTLQSTPSLNPTDWQPVTATSITNNGIATVTLPATNATMFFRLVQ